MARHSVLPRLRGRSHHLGTGLLRFRRHYHLATPQLEVWLRIVGLGCKFGRFDPPAMAGFAAGFRR